MTGGSGFLGSHLCEALLVLGWEPVRMLDEGLAKTIDAFKGLPRKVAGDTDTDGRA